MTRDIGAASSQAQRRHGHLITADYCAAVFLRDGACVCSRNPFLNLRGSSFLYAYGQSRSSSGGSSSWTSCMSASAPTDTRTRCTPSSGCASTCDRTACSACASSGSAS
eukprot:CAMPEP_0119359266 /NCGR_PEP_ID=MMETSP1334-20130426/7194_1 /TAXON_ID=127549 /ORGANISM="Calcidiscus leptoporus, Strain RCC1130" /LENGTH=108 /DNA_ID=CAMNT_0007373907 /DNA_START=340 /DNA_END=667 /DNA_ORIENTATION=+